MTGFVEGEEVGQSILGEHQGLVNQLKSIHLQQTQRMSHSTIDDVAQ